MTPGRELEIKTYNARAHALKEIIIDSRESGDSRSQALSSFLLDIESRNNVPEDSFKDLMEIVWNYVSADHIGFREEDLMLTSALSGLQTKWSSRQRGVMLSLRRCIRKGSFVVFWACLEGRTHDRDERSIDEARWLKIREIMEDIESVWHA